MGNEKSDSVFGFWQQATDIYNLHHEQFKRAVLTDDELEATFIGFLNDIKELASTWHNRPLSGYAALERRADVGRRIA